MKSTHFASICTGTSNAFRRRAGTRSVGTPHGTAYAGMFILEAHACLSEIPPEQALLQMNGSGFRFASSLHVNTPSVGVTSLAYRCMLMPSFRPKTTELPKEN
jgi:hypothetical protein